MNGRISEVVKAVTLMDAHLRNNVFCKNGVVHDQLLWENTFIKRQIDRRKIEDRFTISDHIRAMVYSMLSSGISWQRTEKYVDSETKRLLPIDDLFCEYAPQQLLKCTPKHLCDGIKSLNCGSQYTMKQMQALLDTNIPKLMALEQQYGSIDGYYASITHEDSSYKSLVRALSASGSKDKFKQMGEALTAEYLRNIGYDLAKPDRHIRRILGFKHLACSDKDIVPIFDAFDIVAEIAKELGKPVAEVDYILWAYCANGYGEICKARKPKCNGCVVRDICKTEKTIKEI